MSQPPRNGPIALDTPANPDQAPTAAPRLSGWIAAERSARLPGTSNAPPSPCSERAAMSRPMVGATAQSSDAALNPARPARKTRRRPYLSPSAPPRSMPAVSVTR